MIPRYSRPEMEAIWAPENRFRIWFEIEAHAADAQAALGVIPKSAAREIWRKGKWEIARIDAIERETKHDVIAFLTNLAEHVGPASRFVHQGMTSSDVLDTTLAVQLTQAADLLDAGLARLLAALKRRAHEHKRTPTIGRSHAIHAEPTTFGVKLATFHAEFARGRARLAAARAEIATCAISGAVGTFANVDPRVEAHVARKLKLAPEPVSTQVIPRDRHAMFFATLGGIADEPFCPGAKYSSASSTSVRCRWRISTASRSTELAITPRVAKNIACRSRGMTCVETGSTVSPSLSATCCSTKGSMLAKVPTAPEMAQVAISARAATRRSRLRAKAA